MKAHGSVRRFSLSEQEMHGLNEEQKLSSVSVVIPALNEEQNIAATLTGIPVERLHALGYDVELLVVDNGSTDRTTEIARAHGARVLIQPVRGYGNAYKVGFANSIGDIIATGDADQTYPFEILPDALALMNQDRLDFLSTNRLVNVDREAMTTSHRWANRVLTGVSRALFDNLPFRDSQSGMWIFRRHVWTGCAVQSGGMPFSQEIKVEAFRNGFRCAEIPIPYRPRGGEKKLRSVRDGALVAGHIVAHRLRSPWTRPTARVIRCADNVPHAPTLDRFRAPGPRLAESRPPTAAAPAGTDSAPEATG
jgi:glycosyltransferase involved in cell wall biosynthesis